MPFLVRLRADELRIASLILLWVLTAPIHVVAVQTSDSPSAPEMLVPQNILKLLHAPEVHRELGLNDQQAESLEALFGEVDGDWFRSRNLSQQQQYQAVSALEKRVHQWLTRNLRPEQVQRMKELLYRSQGVRMLLQPSVQKVVGLRTSQIESLRVAAEDTFQADQKLMQAVRSGGEAQQLQQSLKEAIEKENRLWLAVLDDSQKAKVKELLGKEFDTQSLGRIYPMAPEIIPVTDWINSKPLTLAALRGKIVLLHFYAFQCHNCHANFAIYTRWHEKYKEVGVVVLGIQTPETPAESDPQKVRKAAQEKGLEFPIMVDLGSKNWDNWSNTMWPTVYVIDQNGYLRHWWQGELNWQGAKGDEAIEKLVDQLLDEASRP